MLIMLMFINIAIANNGVEIYHHHQCYYHYDDNDDDDGVGMIEGAMFHEGLANIGCAARQSSWE